MSRRDAFEKEELSLRDEREWESEWWECEWCECEG
jgi:hypothetical protein